MAGEQQGKGCTQHRKRHIFLNERATKPKSSLKNKTVSPIIDPVFGRKQSSAIVLEPFQNARKIHMRCAKDGYTTCWFWTCKGRRALGHGQKSGNHSTAAFANLALFHVPSRIAADRSCRANIVTRTPVGMVLNPIALLAPLAPRPAINNPAVQYRLNLGSRLQPSIIA